MRGNGTEATHDVMALTPAHLHQARQVMTYLRARTAP
jgi:hypothetical protein